MVTALLQQNALCVKQGQAFRVQRQARSARMATRQVTKAIGEVNVIVGGSTIAALALGRFVFLPFQRRTNTNAGLPVQNGTTHFEAGDKFAQEASFVLKTNDPAGFNIIDVFAWGALGHVLAYSILASQSVANALPK